MLHFIIAKAGQTEKNIERQRKSDVDKRYRMKEQKKKRISRARHFSFYHQTATHFVATMEFAFAGFRIQKQTPSLSLALLCSVFNLKQSFKYESSNKVHGICVGRTTTTTKRIRMCSELYSIFLSSQTSNKKNPMILSTLTPFRVVFDVCLLIHLIINTVNRRGPL